MNFFKNFICIQLLLLVAEFYSLIVVALPNLSYRQLHGKNKEIEKERVLNGEITSCSPTDFPWVIQLRDPALNKIVCGGALIDEKYILTASHCFGRKRHYEVEVGKLNSSMEFAEILSQRRYVTHVHMLTLPNKVHDLAVAKLNEPVSVTSRSKPIKLPDFETEVTHRSFCIVAGWGSGNTESYGGPEALKKLQVLVWYDQLCYTYLENKFSKTMICGGFTHGLNHAYSYDVGSPLACRENFGDWFLAGINTRMSSNGKYTNFGSPMVFGKVSKATKLIKGILSPDQTEI